MPHVVTPIFFVGFVQTWHRIPHGSMQLFSVCKLWTHHNAHINPLQTRHVGMVAHPFCDITKRSDILPYLTPLRATAMYPTRSHLPHKC